MPWRQYQQSPSTPPTQETPTRDAVGERAANLFLQCGGRCDKRRKPRPEAEHILEPAVDEVHRRPARMPPSNTTKRKWRLSFYVFLSADRTVSGQPGEHAAKLVIVHLDLQRRQHAKLWMIFVPPEGCKTLSVSERGPGFAAFIDD